MSMVLASGDCWRIEVEEGAGGDGASSVVVLVVWKRDDVSRDDVAVAMKKTVPALVPLAGSHKGLVYDLRDAPATWGPIVHKAFVDVLATWDVARKPVAVVAADEAIARLGVKALVNEGAPRRGKACATLEEALAYARA